MKGFVHSLESFGSVDGPGIRFVIFLTGCPMRCQFCHNPDTWTMEAGIEYEVDDLLEKVVKYKNYWGDDGGITVSGGEPLVQIDFVTELFQKAQKLGIHTALDTSGSLFSREEVFFSKFNQLMDVTDLVLLDIKHIDNKAHESLTGRSNINILDCANYLSEINQDVWIRHVLVPGMSDQDEFLEKLSNFIDTLHNVKKVEVLPYHVFGIHKWEQMGMEYPLIDVNPPTVERVENANRILKTEKYNIE